MNLETRILQDLKDAMKNQNQVKKDTLRAIKGAVQLEIINKKKESSDELYLEVIGKQIKMRKDSIEEFKKAGREDLQKSYELEIEILNEYMPKQLTKEELINIVEEVISIVKPESPKDFGKIMKEITPKVKNRCDMKELNELIKNKLQ